MITPMSHYHSAPPSPRVAMTHADAKPPAYLARLQQHVAMGRTPAEAMALIERSEQPGAGRLPSSVPIDMGGKGKSRKAVSAPDQVLPHITRDWQVVTADLCAKIGLHHESIRQALKRLSQAGIIECKRTNGSSPTQWRLK